MLISLKIWFSKICVLLFLQLDNCNKVLNSHQETRLISPTFQDVKGVDFVLYNTVEELEPCAILALQAGKKFTRRANFPT